LGQNGAIFSDGVQDQRFWPQQPSFIKALVCGDDRVQAARSRSGTTLAV